MGLTWIRSLLLPWNKPNWRLDPNTHSCLCISANSASFSPSVDWKQCGNSWSIWSSKYVANDPLTSLPSTYMTRILMGTLAWWNCMECHLWNQPTNEVYTSAHTLLPTSVLAMASTSDHHPWTLQSVYKVTLGTKWSQNSSLWLLPPPTPLGPWTSTSH